MLVWRYFGRFQVVWECPYRFSEERDSAESAEEWRPGGLGQSPGTSFLQCGTVRKGGKSPAERME